MANTTLFAPQVRSVQPAFIYDENNKTNTGKVTIYFSLSDFNEYDDFTNIRYKIIDPNKTSSWGSDSMLQTGEYIEISNPNTDSFEINLFDVNFKPFTTNQYYQIQLQLVNGTNESQWSQISLIRPIPAIKTSIIEQSGKTMYELEKVNGYITYIDGSTIEAIKEYYILIKDENDNETVWYSDLITNVLGTNFATFLYDCNLEDGKYKLYIKYITVNGFEGSISGDNITIGLENIDYEIELNSIGNHTEIAFVNTDIGAVSIEFSFPQDLGVQDSTGQDVILSSIEQIDIQRTSEKSDFTKWLQIKSFDNIDLKSQFKYDDLIIESETLYRYRIVIKGIDTNNNKLVLLANKHKSKDIQIVAELNDIHLLGEHHQLSVKFNPNISGFKYVTQESITNTLGGRFPVIRINGDTKYRQFNLSGTISFNADWVNIGNNGSVDSRDRSMSDWFKEENSTLLFDIQTILNNFSFSDKLPSRNYLEKKYREVAINFLTDQKPKLFRGMAEDNMIVYLSNISFTPNKQLSREVWDFSCTVTEICEYNRENMVRHKLLQSDSISALAQALRIKGFVNGSPLLKLEETFNNIPVLRAFWLQNQKKGFDAAL